VLKFVEQIVEQERACHARQPQRLPNNRTSNRLILRAPIADFPSVTAEVAGSSPVILATLCHTFSVNSRLYPFSAPTFPVDASRVTIPVFPAGIPYAIA